MCYVAEGGGARRPAGSDRRVRASRVHGSRATAPMWAFLASVVAPQERIRQAQHRRLYAQVDCFRIGDAPRVIVRVAHSGVAILSCSPLLLFALPRLPVKKVQNIVSPNIRATRAEPPMSIPIGTAVGGIDF